MYKLSVCIPTYNRYTSLIKQVEYFIEEIDKDDLKIELVVSNNCSTDETRDYLDSVKEKYPKVIVNHNKENLGLIGNLNKVCEIAKGEYIWVVGDDDSIYPGTLRRVFSVLETHNDIMRIFLNYRTIANGDVVEKRVFEGITGYYNDGFEMFSNITEANSLGLSMFLSANIFKREQLLEANEIVKKCGEVANLALPLGWSLFCAIGAGYIIDKVSLDNKLDGISWSDSKIRVFYRDQIAICDLLSLHMGINDRLNNLMIRNLPSSYSEIKFLIMNRNEGLDNYAAKWLWKNFKALYFKDILTFPFYVLKLLFKKTGIKL